MQRPRTLLVLLVLSAVLASAGAAGRADANAEERRGRWIVVLRSDEGTRTDPAKVAAGHGVRPDHLYRAALHGFSFAGSDAAAEGLRHDPRVDKVVAARTLRLVGDAVPVGIVRIGGYTTLAGEPRQRGITLTEPFVPVRVAVLDSGLDTSHPELQPITDARSCAPGSPSIDDVFGHGTHVTGTIAARVNGDGITGLAPEAEIVPVKVVEDDSGTGTDADVICGIDHVIGLMRSDPDPQPTVINMSLGDYGPVGATCADTPLRQAVCNAVAAGIIVVAAAGNDAADIGAQPFVPAAYPEVIAVSAYVDGDGQPGGAAGCQFDWDAFMQFCDDTLADFSNRGSPVDVTAPGALVYSTDLMWIGGYSQKSGTSMASPHAAAAAALVMAANRALSPAQVGAVLRAAGECPDGTQPSGGGSCAGHGQWRGDDDGVAEPLVRADRATLMARTLPPPDSVPPDIALTAPLAGATVSGTVALAASASDGGSGVARVEFSVDGKLLATDTSAPYTASWSTNKIANGTHTITAAAVDNAGNRSTSTATVTLHNVKGKRR